MDDRRVATSSSRDATADLARRTGTVQRALAWYLGTREMPALVGAEYSASLPYGLKLYLGDAPYGAWEP